jgi:hypothetical protein
MTASTSRKLRTASCILYLPLPHRVYPSNHSSTQLKGEQAKLSREWVLQGAGSSVRREKSPVIGSRANE